MKLREVERLRAVAVLMVMVVHWSPFEALMPSWARTSWSGVDLFFVISGYVVTLSLVRVMPAFEAERTFVEAFARARPVLQAFYVRRFFRIMPAALSVMLACWWLAGLFPAKFGPRSGYATELFAFVGGFYNYARPFHHEFKLGVYWSLAVEEHFYLLLPVLLVVFRTTDRRLAACAGIALFSILGRAMPQPDLGGDMAEYQKFASHLRFDSLMAGVALALLADPRPGRVLMPPRLMRFVVLPVVIVAIAALPGVAPASVMQRFGFIALWGLSGFAVAFAGMDRGYVLSYPVVGRALEYVGARSYALYLVHLPVLWIETSAHRMWPGYDRWVPLSLGTPVPRCLVLFAGALLAAELLHRGIERPFIALGKRVLEPRQAVPLVSRRARIFAWSAVPVLTLVSLRHDLLGVLGPPDLARGKPVTMSSHMDGKPDGAALTNGVLESSYGAHTSEDDHPWMTIDLGNRTSLGSVRVYNRDDGYQDEAIPLELQVSDDGVTFASVASRTASFTQQWPWTVRCPGVAARYLRLQVQKKTPFCLSEVEVFAAAWVAAVP